MEEQAEYLPGKGKINLENEGEKRWAQGERHRKCMGRKKWKRRKKGGEAEWKWVCGLIEGRCGVVAGHAATSLPATAPLPSR